MPCRISSSEIWSKESYCFFETQSVSSESQSTVLHQVVAYLKKRAGDALTNIGATDIIAPLELASLCVCDSPWDHNKGYEACKTGNDKQ